MRAVDDGYIGNGKGHACADGDDAAEDWMSVMKSGSNFINSRI